MIMKKTNIITIITACALPFIACFAQENVPQTPLVKLEALKAESRETGLSFGVWAAAHRQQLEEIAPEIAQFGKSAGWFAKAYCCALNVGKDTWTDGIDMLKQYSYPDYIRFAASEAEIDEALIAGTAHPTYCARGYIRLELLPEKMNTLLGKGVVESAYRDAFLARVSNATVSEARALIDAEMRGAVKAPLGKTRTDWINELRLLKEIYASLE